MSIRGVVAVFALLLLAAPAQAQSTGAFASPARHPSSLVLDVGGYMDAGTESADIYAVVGVMPFRLEGSIEVAVLGPRLTAAVTGSFGGLFDAALRDSRAAGRAFYGDLWAVTNPMTGARLIARATDAIRLLFGLDLVWPGRDVHEGDLGSTTEPEQAVLRAQGLDGWDPFLYQGGYAHVATRFELEVLFDSTFLGGELGVAAGVPASARVGWTTVCAEVGLYVGTRLTPEVALGVRVHGAVVDDGPRVVGGLGSYIAANHPAYGLAAIAPFLRVEHDVLLAELRGYLTVASDELLPSLPGPLAWSIHTRLGVRFDAHR